MSLRRLVWAALVLQAIGFVIDAVWHGAMHAELEGAAKPTIVHHLLTVHVVFFAGVLALLLVTGWAVIAARRTEVDFVAPLAFAGAMVQTIGQVWDVNGHLHGGNGGPVAWTMIVLGPVVVIAALLFRPRRARHRMQERSSAG